MNVRRWEILFNDRLLYKIFTHPLSCLYHCVLTQWGSAGWKKSLTQIKMRNKLLLYYFCHIAEPTLEEAVLLNLFVLAENSCRWMHLQLMLLLINTFGSKLVTINLKLQTNS